MMYRKLTLEKTLVFKIICLLWLPVLASCAVNHKVSKPMTLNYIEYDRGKSFPTRSDIGLVYDNHDYTFHNVDLEDESFFPDNSFIPNAFLKPLSRLRFSAALNAFTEPYYSYRFLHFFKKNPHIGIGVELIHLKVFLIDKDQRVKMRGTYNGEPAVRTVRIGDFLDYLSVSHGVNHVGLLFNYRWMLKKTPLIPDGRYQPFISFSIGPTAPHLELNLKNEDKVERKAYSYQWAKNNWGLSMGGGIRYKFSRHFGLFLEYRLTYSYLHGMYFDDEPGTRVTMDFWAHQFQWGISFMF